MKTLFTKIIERALPAHIVAEDDAHIAILDLYPKVYGHTLVVPKRAEAYLWDLDDEALATLWCFAKKVSRSLEQVVPCQRIASLVLGMEVPHVHVHLLPIQTERDLCMCRAGTKATDAELAALAKRLRRACR